MWPSMHCRRKIIALVVALAVAVAIAVAVHSTVAAPQSDGDATITIDGQQSDGDAKITIDDQQSGDDATITIDGQQSGDDATITIDDQQSDGDATITIDGQQCKCVPFNKCLSNNTINGPSSAGSCSRNKVCCIDDNVSSCGIGMSPPNTIHSDYIEPRIVNVEDNSNTHFGQFPWMAAILKTNINEETGINTENVFICGGSLIHPRVVLTAAHCVSKDVELIQVRVGVWDTQCPDNEENSENSCEDVGVSKIVYHPNYDNETIYNDVALVELESEIILHPHINIICIPDSENQINYDPQSCVTTGWGQNGLDPNIYGYQTVLKKVDLSVVPNDLCQQKLRTTKLGENFVLHESFLCAGGITGVDACKGDGGGPLICSIKKDQGETKKYIQVGIVSWGIGCGEENIPGVYSSVAFNSQWINKELKTITSE